MTTGMLRNYAVLLILLLFSGCGVSPDDVRVTAINPRGWEPSDTVSVVMNNTDTVSLRDILLIIRSNTRLREEDKNVGLTIGVRAPDSTFYDEKFTASIPHDQKSSGITDTDIPYRTLVKLTQKGAYTFCLTPLKNTVGLEGIGVGIVIRK